MAKVLVFSTKGARQTTVETSATTWGELKKDLTANNIQFDGMQAVVRETKGILKLDGAVLPKGLSQGDKVTDDFTLFLSPSKQTAGCNSETATYSELKSFIKNNRKGNESFFGDYTHQTTQGLRKLVAKWNAKNTSKVGAQPKVVVETEEVEADDKLTRVLTLLQEAVEIVSELPGVKESALFTKLNEEAAAIEFELNN